MRVTPRRNLRVFGMLAATLLLLAGTSGALAQPVPGKASPEETCKQCHADYLSGYARSKHGTKADLRAPANNGGCLACHGDAALEHAAKGGGRGVGGVLGFNDKKVSAETKSAVCLNCHKGNPNRIHWEQSTHAARDNACTSCHQVHTANDPVRDRTEQAQVCFNCHKDKRAEFRRPSRHPIDEGKVVCSNCHNPHGGAGPKQLVQDSVVETCYGCHMEKRGPFIWNHQPVTEDCTLCHNPHGTVNPTLLKARSPFLCQECHEPTSHRATAPDASPVTGTPPNPSINQEVMLGRGCMNCHNNIHGGSSPVDSSSSRSFRR